MRKRAYRAISAKDVKISEAIARLAEGRICVGLDISKAEAFAVVRDSLGRYERPWKAKQPAEVRHLVQLLGELANPESEANGRSSQRLDRPSRRSRYGNTTPRNPLSPLLTS